MHFQAVCKSTLNERKKKMYWLYILNFLSVRKTSVKLKFYQKKFDITLLSLYILILFYTDIVLLPTPKVNLIPYSRCEGSDSHLHKAVQTVQIYRNSTFFSSELRKLLGREAKCQKSSCCFILCVCF